MRHVCLLFLIVATHLVWAGVAPSADVSVEGGDVSLSITTATAGQDPDPVVDQTTANLSYRKGTGSPMQKITVETNRGSPLFTLSVEAINVGNGVATGEITLVTTAQDLITSISANNFVTADLKYTLTALASDGTGTDVHTVTYTTIAN